MAIRRFGGVAGLPAGYAIRRAYQSQEAHVDQVDARQTEV